MKAISLLILVLACSSHHIHEKGPMQLTPEMVTCYEKSQALKDHKEGIMKVWFTITTDGRTVNPKITENAFTEPAFDECVLNVLRHTTYQPQMMTTDVSQPIHFARKE